MRLRASRVNTLAETVTQEEKEFSLQYTSPSTHFLHAGFGISIQYRYYFTEAEFLNVQYMFFWA